MSSERDSIEDLSKKISFSLRDEGDASEGGLELEELGQLYLPPLPPLSSDTPVTATKERVDDRDERPRRRTSRRGNDMDSDSRFDESGRDVLDEERAFVHDYDRDEYSRTPSDNDLDRYEHNSSPSDNELLVDEDGQLEIRTDSLRDVFGTPHSEHRNSRGHGPIEMNASTPHTTPGSEMYSVGSAYTPNSEFGDLFESSPKAIARDSPDSDLRAHYDGSDGLTHREQMRRRMTRRTMSKLKSESVLGEAGLKPKDEERMLRRIAGLIEDMRTYEKMYARNSQASKFGDSEENLTLIVHKDGATFKSNYEAELLEKQKVCNVHDHCACLCCWDEDDDGVLPICRSNPQELTEGRCAWWKIFNQHHTLTNNNALCFLFGTIGFRFFDIQRSKTMAVAMYMTLFSIFFTFFGCMAFSVNPHIVRTSYWAVMQVTNSTSGLDRKLHMGLSSMVMSMEPCNIWDCTMTNLEYGNQFMFGGVVAWGDESGDEWPQSAPFLKKHLEECTETLYGERWGAMLTCVTLLFALIGASNRMRFSADIHVQKALGMITDLVGFVSLAISLTSIRYACDLKIPRKKGDIEVMVWLGPGYLCYVFCLFAALTRVILHWVTPTPQKWKEGTSLWTGGCCLQTGQDNLILPVFIQDLFIIEDEDGKKHVGLSWANFLKLIRRFRDAPSDFLAFAERNRNKSDKNILQWTSEQINRINLDPLNVGERINRMNLDPLNVGDRVMHGVNTVGHGVVNVGKASLQGAQTVGMASLHGAQTVGKASLRGAQTVGKTTMHGVNATIGMTETVAKAGIRGVTDAGGAVVDGVARTGTVVVDGVSHVTNKLGEYIPEEISRPTNEAIKVVRMPVDMAVAGGAAVAGETARHMGEAAESLRRRSTSITEKIGEEIGKRRRSSRSFDGDEQESISAASTPNGSPHGGVFTRSLSAEPESPRRRYSRFFQSFDDFVVSKQPREPWQEGETKHAAGASKTAEGDAGGEDAERGGGGSRNNPSGRKLKRLAAPNRRSGSSDTSSPPVSPATTGLARPESPTSLRRVFGEVGEGGV